jgi:hypothetical protein
MLTVLILAAASLGFSEEAGMAKKASWNIAGQLEEACKCNAACPCWFNARPTRMNCGGQLVYFITKGKYNDISLDGLAFARTGQSPDGEKMMDAFGNWIFDYSYIDEKASAEQRKALEAISWAIMPAASPNVKVRYAPLTRVIEGKEHKIKIGDYGRFSGQLMGSVLGGTPTVSNVPFADPIRKEYQQGTTTEFLYTDAEQKWDSKDSNYMFTSFETDSDQYEKYGAMILTGHGTETLSR